MNDGPSNGGVLTEARQRGPQASLGRFGVASPEQLHRDREPREGPRQRGRRRRWPWVLAGVATAAALCAGAFVVGRVTKPAPPAPAPPPPPPATAGVVALAQPVTEGQALGANDLTVITIVTGPGVRKGTPPRATKVPYFPASMETRLVGQHVRRDLPSGALLVAAELTNSPFPARGQALVGLDLQPNETPTGGALLPGDQAGVLYVPAASQPPYPAPKPLVTAQVVASVAGQSGDSYVTVLVPAGIAARLAAYAQHDEVALVRLGPTVAWPPPTTRAKTTATTKTTATATKPAAPKTVPVTTTRPAPPTAAHHDRVGGTSKTGTGKSGTGTSGTGKSGTGKKGRPAATRQARPPSPAKSK